MATELHAIGRLNRTRLRGLIAGMASAVLVAGCVTVSAPPPTVENTSTPRATQAESASPSPSASVPSATATPPSPTATVNASPTTLGVIKLGIDMPLSGSDARDGKPTANGALLAIDQANGASAVAGYSLVDKSLDDTLAGQHDPATGATNMHALVADPSVLAVVGPFNSDVARVEIPVSNEAGLAQCSPTTLVDDLTLKGSDAYRFHGQDERNFIRVVAPFTTEGTGMAEYVYGNIAARAAFVMDDDTQFGYDQAESFSDRFKALGGQVVGRDYVPFGTHKYKRLIQDAKTLHPDVLYFGVADPADAAAVRQEMADEGMSQIPFVAPDSILDFQPGGAPGGFITLTGLANSHHVYSGLPGIFELAPTSDFESAYTARFGTQSGFYSSAAFVCAQVLIQAIAATAAAADNDLAKWRSLVRDYLFATPAHTFVTDMGTISFDANGDIQPATIGIYAVDANGEFGRGAWEYSVQVTVTP